MVTAFKIKLLDKWKQISFRMVILEKMKILLSVKWGKLNLLFISVYGDAVGVQWIFYRFPREFYGGTIHIKF